MMVKMTTQCDNFADGENVDEDRPPWPGDDGDVDEYVDGDGDGEYVDEDNYHGQVISLSILQTRRAAITARPNL